MLCLEARQTEKGEEAFLLRKGLNKQLQDEMVPIGYFCEKFFIVRPDLVQVSLVLGNQTFDAVVRDNRVDSSGIDYLEVACVEDCDEHRSRECMLDEGFATVRKSVGDIFAMLNGIIQKKCPKNYPENTVLLMYSKIDYSLEIYDAFEFEYASVYRPLIDARFKAVFILDRNKMKRL